MFKRNADKLFPLQENNSEKKRKCDSKVNSSAVNDMKIITEAVESSEKTQNGSTQPASTEQIILEAELDLTKQELTYHNETKYYQRAHYSQRSSEWKKACQPKRSSIL